MGSVKLETRNDGRGQREWDYVTLGEARIVTMLIKNRSKLDASFYPSLSDASFETSGVFPFSEPVICTYIDLDKLIDVCGLSKTERLTVDYLMRGYTFSDLQSIFGKSRQTFEKLFSRAVDKICRANNDRWRSVYSMQGKS